jgi:hypothetical protein
VRKVADRDPDPGDQLVVFDQLARHRLDVGAGPQEFGEQAVALTFMVRGECRAERAVRQHPAIVRRVVSEVGLPLSQSASEMVVSLGELTAPRGRASWVVSAHGVWCLPVPRLHA